MTASEIAARLTEARRIGRELVSATGRGELLAAAEREIELWNRARAYLVATACDEVTNAMIAGDAERHEQACLKYQRTCAEFDQAGALRLGCFRELPPEKPYLVFESI